MINHGYWRAIVFEAQFTDGSALSSDEQRVVYVDAERMNDCDDRAELVKLFVAEFERITGKAVASMGYEVVIECEDGETV